MGFTTTTIAEYLLLNSRHANPRLPVKFRRKLPQNETPISLPRKKCTLHDVANGVTSKI